VSIHNSPNDEAIPKQARFGGGTTICYLTPDVDAGRLILVVGGPETIHEEQSSLWMAG